MNHYILIWSVCTFVESRVREEIHLEELVHQTGFSLAHIRDVFRKRTGKPLSRYVQERKIANAAQELLDTDKAILDIAVQYGFSGRTVFSRAFQRHTGYTPYQFRDEAPVFARVRLCAGVYGAALPKRQSDGNHSRAAKRDNAILYSVPKVDYGPDGCTPFPMCIHSCAKYLGLCVDYTRAMAESGAAFRLVWNTACWDGGNVDAIFTFDDPVKLFLCGIRAMERELKFMGRTPQTKKEDFMDFIRREINVGNPVIALGIIGPPEACIITGYREGGNVLMGWNVFQEYPEYRTCVRFENNCYFITEDWWENPDTTALIATGTKSLPPLTSGEVLRNAAEALKGRMCGTYAKGILAYDAWKNALLCDRDFPAHAVLPLLTERMMCHGDAMDCLSDGRYYAAKYLRRLAEQHPTMAPGLNAAAGELERIPEIIRKEMIPVLGGWERGEAQTHRLARAENRRLLAGQIERMKAHDERAYGYILELLDGNI
ncbi:MAG: helix-turn-helix transcriptional regulator [Lachnospiraceae bacterium]|nr:helix-turn-helix transcriptional regulator [Lachnospiraceae bacterium]